MPMSYKELQFLIHYHTSHAPHPEANDYKNAIAALVNDDLLVSTNNSGGYTTTEKGKAHMKQLLELPFPPPRQWVLADGRKL